MFYTDASDQLGGMRRLLDTIKTGIFDSAEDGTRKIAEDFLNMVKKEFSGRTDVVTSLVGSRTQEAQNLLSDDTLSGVSSYLDLVKVTPKIGTRDSYYFGLGFPDKKMPGSNILLMTFHRMVEHGSQAAGIPPAKAVRVAFDKLTANMASVTNAWMRPIIMDLNQRLARM